MIICPLCKSESKLIWKERKYKVYRCLNCKVAFLYPVPETEKIYNRDYFEKWYLKYYEERKQYFKNLIEKLKNYFPEKGKILDIGCGAGIFLDIMKEMDWDVYGQDISPFAVKYCENKGYTVYKNLSEINKEGTFDVITMFDVIAHIPDPLLYLNQCRKLLKKGGILIIKTPSHSNFLFTVSNLLSFTGKSRTLLHIPAQIYHFNSFSLKKALEEESFLLEDIFFINEFFSNFTPLNALIQTIFDKKSIISISMKDGK